MSVETSTERDDDASAARRLDRAAARLLRGRLGDEPLLEAVIDAEECLERPGVGVTGDSPLFSVVRLHLGTAQLQLGRLVDADPNLAEAMQFGRSSGLTALSSEAASGLALSQFLQGREYACLELAADVLSSDVPHAYATMTRGGLLLARDLALLQAVVDTQHDAAGASLSVTEPLDPSHEEDVVSIVLTRLLTARRLLLRGLVTDAERALDGDSIRSRLPAPLQLPVLLEQALQAALARDDQHLTRLERELVELGAPGEAAYVAALRAEGAGDTRAALDLFTVAVDESTCVQPPVVAMALAGRAQLRHGEGRAADASADLRAALTATEVRRNALPFLGWSRHGSPVATLLREVFVASPSVWGVELLRALDAKPGIASLAGTLTATPGERAHVPDGVVRPTLSPRERDVLHELARGARYADIAANLFVSENTVKTHVSSLYAKLAVSRRSDALAVARTLALL
jgi:DNA-binding CsgD family transcriptional regulator